MRDQSRKLPEIARNFGRFFTLPNFTGAGLPKIVQTLARGTSYGKKDYEDILTRPEVIDAHTLNFRPNF